MQSIDCCCSCVLLKKYFSQKLFHFLVFTVRLIKLSRVKVKFVLTNQVEPWPHQTGVFCLKHCCEALAMTKDVATV